MKRLLQLSTYPIVNPLHGGQIRVSQIRHFFVLKGWEVKSISISEMSHADYTKDDYLLDEMTLKMACNELFCADYATSLLSTTDKIYSFLKERIVAFDPTMIFIEQAWLWPAVKKMIQENVIKEATRIVYSSHNIEFETKKILLDSHKALTQNALNIIDNIRALESELCQSAHCVVSCTQADADILMALGAHKTMVCNNGVSRRLVDSTITHELLHSLQERRYVLFVGSAYPPNALGFWKMMGKSLAWLPPETMVIAAGGVSKILEDYMPEDAKLYAYVSMDKIKRLGFVSEGLLSSLVENASAIILPITIGGGSNLKTAEAIASKRPIVATTTAARGFSMEGLTSCTITDDPEAFVVAVSLYLKQDFQGHISQEESDRREMVYWDQCLKNLEYLC